MILVASVKPNQNNAYTKINTKHTLKRYNETILAKPCKNTCEKSSLHFEDHYIFAKCFYSFVGNFSCQKSFQFGFKQRFVFPLSSLQDLG